MAIPNKFGHNDSQGVSLPDPRTTVGLASWCMSRVRLARDDRDERYEGRWREYTRLWRGFWQEGDKTYDSERSRLISPATMQAIEMTVAEMEEATFNKKQWFDIDDNLADEEVDVATSSRDLLLEEFELNNVQGEVGKVFLLGAIYGTGIAKINVTKIPERVMVGDSVKIKERIAVTVEAIRPDQFVIDTSALSVDEAEFCAHEMLKPRHTVKDKQAQGLYLPGVVGVWTGNVRASTDGTERHSSADPTDNGVLITEYYGKVPASMLPDYKGKELMVEALVTIANEGVILKAVESPFTMKDRPVMAYQHDVIPGEFWGRGVTEKGYNPQKALDTEQRSRADALALMNAPMMGADITRLPRNPDLRVRPGKTIFARGNPNEVFSAIAMGNPAVLQSTFQQAADMERMVTMATGAMDSAAPLQNNRRNETASGMSMMGGGFLKRAKRSMRNVERGFLTPMIRKAMWRYQQFDPERFPADFKFLPKSTLGIVAKEVENQQLTNMLGFLQEGSPEYKTIVKAIFDNSSSANKAELQAAMEAMMAPPTEEQQQMQQMQQELAMKMAQLEVAEKEAQVAKIRAETELASAKAAKEIVLADLEDDKVEIQAANAVTGAQRVREEGRKVDAVKARPDA